MLGLIGDVYHRSRHGRRWHQQIVCVCSEPRCFDPLCLLQNPTEEAPGRWGEGCGVNSFYSLMSLLCVIPCPPYSWSTYPGSCSPFQSHPNVGVGRDGPGSVALCKRLPEELGSGLEGWECWARQSQLCGPQCPHCREWITIAHTWWVCGATQTTREA